MDAKSGPPEPLFPKLTGRSSGIAPEQVASHQRRRMVAAMIEAVSRNGYEGVTVAEIVALAGVSKTAFYRQFANKEECFFATYEEIVDLGAEQIAAAYGAGDGFRAGMGAALGKFAELVIAQTAAARLVLVDSLILGASAMGPRGLTAARYETLIRQSFEAASLPGEVSELAIRGIYGGLRDFAHHCLRDGRPERLGEHAAELADWGVSYRLAAADGPSGPGTRLVAAAEERRPDPAGIEAEPVADAPPWEEPANSKRSRETLTQRERIMRAAAQVAVRDGYAALRVPAISTAAGTSNQTFYEHFGSKQEAFLAAFDALALEAFQVTAATFAKGDGWLHAGAAGVVALLEHVARSPLFRQMNFFELYAAGPIARDRAEAMLVAFTTFMQPDPLPPEVPRVPSKAVLEAIAGGLWAVIQYEIRAGRSDSLPQLAPQIVDFVLLPFGVE
jgi:AcrR family transcriptional regulator